MSKGKGTTWSAEETGRGEKSRSRAEGHSGEASSFTDVAGWLWKMLETGPPNELSIAV